MTYDSKGDTLEHIAKVQEYLGAFSGDLLQRAKVHDQSKLEDPEKPLFDEMTPKLRALTYGSDEYEQARADLGVALDHHYKNNDHHPEHFEWLICLGACRNWIYKPEHDYSDIYETHFLCPGCGCSMAIDTKGAQTAFEVMSLQQITELLCDWKAATERHADGDIVKSLKINMGRFRIPKEIIKVMVNTCAQMGWIDGENGRREALDYIFQWDTWRNIWLEAQPQE